MNGVLERLWNKYGSIPVGIGVCGKPDFTDLIREILEDSSANDIPISVNKIYDEFGIRLTQNDFSEQGENENVVGYIVAMSESHLPKDEPYSVIATVRSTDPIVRKRFTAAHELYHAIKDMYHSLLKSGSSVSFVRMVGSDVANHEDEGTADEFAAQLLMPTDKLKEVFDSLPFKSICVLADMFGVSPENMMIRLDNLGISNYIDDTTVACNSCEKKN